MGFILALVGMCVGLALIINLVSSIYRVLVAKIDEYHDVPQRIAAEQTLEIWLAFAVLCAAVWAAWS